MQITISFDNGAKTKKELSVLIEITKRPSRAVRVDVTVVIPEWRQFIAQ